MKKRLLFTYVALQDFVVWHLARWDVTHRLLLSPGIEPYRWKLGQWRAFRTFEKAKRRVPAYKDYLRQQHYHDPTSFRGGVDFSGVPEMDKKSYIVPYRAEERCWDGVLPTRGVLVDESSGSSGHPTSWVRGKEERSIVKEILQAGFSALASDRPIFVINAFAMGAWATGMATTMALLENYIVKATGPDQKKIIETITDFGDGYQYVILGYPPFLKDLVDNPDFDVKKYDITAIYGGEAMSESLRDYLLQYFRFVAGSYGASDLEINIAAENNFTIALRKELLANTELRKELTKTEYGVLPMVFQYNPFDYLIGPNEQGELLVTITRSNNINPRIKYNIHDLGHVLRLRDLRPILEKHGAGKLLSAALVDFPLLFYYGRSDLSLDFYGAVVSPESLRQVLYTKSAVAKKIHTFRMVVFEEKNASKRLLFAIELEEGHKKSEVHEAELHSEIIGYLEANNLDFKQALSVAHAAGCEPVTRVYEYDQGIFKRVGTQKLKNEYIWNLTYDAAIAAGVTKRT